MATHSSILAWKTPWTEELGRLQSLRLYSLAAKTTTKILVNISLLLSKATPVFLPGESQGQGSLVGCRLWGHTESDTTELT